MQATDLHPGSVVDRYTVEEPIGEGGMALVFRVRHNVLGTRHALKVLTLASPQIRARLEREGQLQAALRHPNIVAVTDVVDVGGATALVLELVDGPALDAVLRARRLTFEEIDLLVPGILAGVAAAHQHGYVHRDLKPANVLLARTGSGTNLVAKVADFGLAKIADGSDASGARTRTGSTMGTPQYMSPEQIRDTKGVGPASDVFALGAVLYEMVTGRRAFDGADLLDIFNAVAAARYVPVAELVPEAPERMVRAIDAALRVDPAERPTVLELAGLWGADLAAVHSVAMSLPAAAIASSARVHTGDGGPGRHASNAPRTPDTWASGVVPAPAAAPVSEASSGASSASVTLSRAAWAVGLGGSLVSVGAAGALGVVLVAAIGWRWFEGPAAPVVVPVPVALPAGAAPAEAREVEHLGVSEVRDVGEIVTPAPVRPPSAPPAPEPPPSPMQTAPEPEPPDPDGIPELGAEAVPEPVPALVVAPEPVGGAPALPEAFGMLASEDPGERIVAAENLAARIADPDAAPRLIALATSDGDEDVRRVAGSLAIDLYVDAHGDLEPAVVWLMRNGPEGLAVRAVEAYRARGADPNELAEAFAHPSARVRVVALKTLPVVAPRAPDGVAVDHEALVGPLLGDDQTPAVRRLADETLRKLAAGN